MPTKNKPRPKWGWHGGGWIPEFSFEGKYLGQLKEFLGEEEIARLATVSAIFLQMKKDQETQPTRGEILATLELLEKETHTFLKHLEQMDQITDSVLTAKIAVEHGDLGLQKTWKKNLLNFWRLLIRATHDFDQDWEHLHKKGRRPRWDLREPARRVGRVVQNSGRPLTQSDNGDWTNVLRIVLESVGENQADPRNIIRAVWNDLKE